jgi:serine/threonine protein kinase
MEIPGFSMHEELGRGGSAIVYKATEVALGRTVAVKVLIHLSVDERLFQRFSQECEAMGGLSWHPHVVTVHGQGTTPEGLPYLVMEHLDQGSLADRLERESKLPWQDTMHYGVQVTDALEAAHERGLLHRDVKPENVLLDRFGDAKLADFGIATVTGGVMTATGIITATVAHAAPEVVGGARATVASDLYSLGSTLYTLCAGGPPFLRSEDESILQLIARVAVEPPPDLRSYGVPDDVTALVERLLAKEPSQRPAEAGSVIQSLQDLQSRHGETPTSTRRRPASPGVITRPLPGEGDTDRPKRSTDQVATGGQRPPPTPRPPGRKIALGTGAAVVVVGVDRRGRGAPPQRRQRRRQHQQRHQRQQR